MTRGQDVLAVVSARDDRHLDFAGRGRCQGVTREHYIELELPADARPTGPLWLIGAGFIPPTVRSMSRSARASTTRREGCRSVADAKGVLRPFGRDWASRPERTRRS